MVWSFELIIYVLVLIDSIFANIIFWCCPGWYKKNFKGFYKYFPMNRGLAAWYLILVLWVGYGLFRLGILSF